MALYKMLLVVAASVVLVGLTSGQRRFGRPPGPGRPGPGPRGPPDRRRPNPFGDDSSGSRGDSSGSRGDSSGSRGDSSGSRGDRSGSSERWGPWSCCSCPGGATQCPNGVMTRTLIGTARTDTRVCQDCEGAAFLVWSQWSTCTATCGSLLLGEKTRTRQCPATGACAWTQERTVRCEATGCTAGVLGAWGPWGACSVTCGTGRQSRERTCTGGVCDGPTTDRRLCNTATCPVGVWTVWSTWSACSATCGRAVSSRTRTCTTLPTVPCLGSELVTRRCLGLPDCPPAPIGTWGEWAAWTSCSVTCGLGYRTRSRVCPAGTRCVGGRRLEFERCGTRGSCEGAAWNPWGAWTTCSASCGGGTRNRARTCSDPANTCIGSSTATENCNSQPCPAWSTWGAYSACSVTCGVGMRTRTRVCNNASPTMTCPGSNTETVTCTEAACPDPTWTAWGAWSTCSATCGTGTRSRSRTCTAGATCSGSATESEACNTNACSVCGISKYANAGTVSVIAPAIVGGTDAKANELPWQCNLREVENLSSIFCGCTILNATHVLTAAHCVTGEAPGTFRVYAGENSLSTTEASQQSSDVSQVISHPNYDDNTLDNDVAVVRLATPLTLNENVMPICLPSPGQSFIGQEVVISGWGVLSTDAQTVPDMLQEAVVVVVADSVCQNAYSYHAIDVICGSDTFNNNQRSACFGDSGGPMVAQQNGVWVLVGVTSYVHNDGCAASKPFGYRDVVFHLDFIKYNQVTQKAQFP